MFDLGQVVGGMQNTSGGMLDGWSNVLQKAAGHWAGSAIDNRYNQQYELQKMAMAQMGPSGVPYFEGQANGGQPVIQASAAIPQSWLIIGGILALVVFMGD